MKPPKKGVKVSQTKKTYWEFPRIIEITRRLIERLKKIIKKLCYWRERNKNKRWEKNTRKQKVWKRKKLSLNIKWWYIKPNF